MIKTESAEKTYAALKEDFIIYKIKVRDFFAVGDAVFISDVYYLESAKSLQLTVRIKNNDIKQILGESVQKTPFKLFLSVFTKEGQDEKGAVCGNSARIDPSDKNAFGNDESRYRYFVYSFENVEIDYANSTVELYIFPGDEENFPNEEYAMARFTIFDINMPKEKLPAKKFGWN